MRQANEMRLLLVSSSDDKQRRKDRWGHHLRARCRFRRDRRVHSWSDCHRAFLFLDLQFPGLEAGGDMATAVISLYIFIVGLGLTIGIVCIRVCITRLRSTLAP
jgi:hypothetical protein